MISSVPGRKDGLPNKPGQGRPQKEEGTTVEKKAVSLYPWEWKELLTYGKGTADSLRKLLEIARKASGAPSESTQKSPPNPEES